MTHKADLKTGIVLQRLRKRAGISQETLAERVGVSAQQIQKYEKGQNRVSVGRLFDIAEVLGTMPGVIIDLVQRELEIDRNVL